MPAGTDTDGVGPDRKRVMMPGRLAIIREPVQRGLHERKDLWPQNRWAWDPAHSTAHIGHPTARCWWGQPGR